MYDIQNMLYTGTGCTALKCTKVSIPIFCVYIHSYNIYVYVYICTHVFGYIHTYMIKKCITRGRRTHSSCYNQHGASLFQVCVCLCICVCVCV